MYVSTATQIRPKNTFRVDATELARIVVDELDGILAHLAERHILVEGGHVVGGLRALGVVEALELDGLRVVDEGGEERVDVGGGARVLVLVEQRPLLLLRQLPAALLQQHAVRAPLAARLLARVRAQLRVRLQLALALALGRARLVARLVHVGQLARLHQLQLPLLHLSESVEQLNILISLLLDLSIV